MVSEHSNLKDTEVIYVLELVKIAMLELFKLVKLDLNLVKLDLDIHQNIINTI